ncbi:hypothetical protein [Nocardioides sp. W7]|uniref:hypothetical protein n=1 Tax=Nocardioides sp. W7 TaxID=2931390 RepID=UPI001FD5A72D|nr:hypothetical protein [Nocardioides sp. W7]
MNTTTPRTLVQDLDVLHGSYVSAINQAIDSGHDEYVAELAASYDREATLMVAQREGKTHLLPLRRRRAA